MLIVQIESVVVLATNCG